MSPLSCILVDDEPAALEVLEGYVAQIPYLSCEGSFRDPIEALTFLQEHTDIDLVFVDINMPRLNGTQFVRTLPGAHQYVFTTAYSEYAVESYELEVMDYLLKPIAFDRFLKTVMKVHRQRGEQTTPTETKAASNDLFIKSGRQIHRVSLPAIRYIRKDGHYAEFYLEGRKIVARLTMDELALLLPEDAFLQIHKSYLIALSHVRAIESHQVTIGDEKLPVGKSFRDKVMGRFA